MKQWQSTSFVDASQLTEWMNAWNFIKVEHIVSHPCGDLVAFYRHKREISPYDTPTDQDHKEALYT